MRWWVRPVQQSDKTGGGSPMGKSKLVHIVDEVPALLDHEGRLVMVQVLDGFLDAGNASVRAARHLVESSATSPVVATFDVDAFHDYRARRPPVTFARDHYEDYETPRLVVQIGRASCRERVS
jgi:hypothetical protein